MSYRKNRILIVDDDLAIQESLQLVLEEDYNLECVGSAIEALELLFFFGEPFDLIILDIIMPMFLLNKKPQLFHPAVVQCLTEIHKHFHAAFNIKGIASICGVSEYHLCKLFKKDCGMTIRDYVGKLRMATAQELLKNFSYKICDIHEMIGYNGCSPQIKQHT